MRKRQLIIIGSIFIISLIGFFFVLLMPVNDEKISIILNKDSLIQSNNSLTTRMNQSQAIASKSVLSRMSNEIEVNDSAVTVQDQGVAQHPSTPVFYQISSANYASLDPAVSSAVGMAIYDFKTFYDQWMKTYPRDISQWNDKVREIENELHSRLGGDGYDNLLKSTSTLSSH